MCDSIHLGYVGAWLDEETDLAYSRVGGKPTFFRDAPPLEDADAPLLDLFDDDGTGRSGANEGTTGAASESAFTRKRKNITGKLPPSLTREERRVLARTAQAGPGWSLCRGCEKPMTLFCQFFSPLGGFERLLHVFCCGGGCSSKDIGWRVYRSKLLRAQEEHVDDQEPVEETVGSSEEVQSPDSSTRRTAVVELDPWTGDSRPSKTKETLLPVAGGSWGGASFGADEDWGGGGAAGEDDWTAGGDDFDLGDCLAAAKADVPSSTPDSSNQSSEATSCYGPPAVSCSAPIAQPWPNFEVDFWPEPELAGGARKELSHIQDLYRRYLASEAGAGGTTDNKGSATDVGSAPADSALPSVAQMGNIADDDDDDLFRRHRHQGQTSSRSSETGRVTSDSDEDCDDPAAAFVTFQKRLQRAPGQIVRYGGNKPLPMTAARPPAIADCPRCGGKRGYEFSLLSTLLSHVEVPAGAGEPPSFGTAHFYTCSQDCGGEKLGPTEEFIWLEDEI